jgi:hypothetical protein
MKQLIVILSLFLLFSCNSDYTVVDTKIVKGRVSAIEKGNPGSAVPQTFWSGPAGVKSSTGLPKIYVQDSKQTIAIDIPFANEHDYKIGDSITVIIQQVEQFKKK